MKRAKAATNISCGTLYPALQRLAKRGLVKKQTAQENLDVRNGHSRCYYQVTQEGHEVLLKIETIRTQIKSQHYGNQALT